ncbi:hypothetical protein Pcinc_016091 [Petrolisthes cinctipes]|uniref:Glucosylceramidase n=1 Tax=Petrolisthes cinctipes TaxID=88211 RepID=A0AAE1FSZ5_PETCI|nr:hypothetical protein Pcinc_016091 [Petrolisthes cinctipes]
MKNCRLLLVLGFITLVFVVVMLMLLLLLVPALVAGGTECNPRDFGADSVVCVCTASDCDLQGVIPVPADGLFTTVTSSRDGLRFAQNTSSLESTPDPDADVSLTLDPNTDYQTIFGFGGGFTDSTGINIATLPLEAQDFLIRSYFSPDGIEYNLCRLPMAGTDYSIRPYSYDDVEGDVDLVHFNLTIEDYQYKLPYIKQAQQVANRKLLLFGSPFSPPAWMKESGTFNGSGSILKEMWEPYANYFIKFLQAYEAEGAPVWGVTMQDEPLAGLKDAGWNNCYWSPEDTRDWIKTYLGPAMESAGYGDVQLMIHDQSRDTIPDYVSPCLDDAGCYQYVDGTALHWYANWRTSTDSMDETHNLYPEKYLLYTESCEGWNAGPDEKVILGSWVRAENYAFDILEDLNHWATGWVDWNMALSMGGGPNWVNNAADSPIIINTDAGEFYKQPMFYALGHFSKFIPPGSIRMASSVSGPGSGDVIAVAVHDIPSLTDVVIILNRGDSGKSVSVDTGSGVEFMNFAMPAKSITTVLFQEH